MLEVRMRTPLEMQLPYGEKLIKSKHSALWVPVSPRVPLPASMHQVMAVCFTPLSYTVASDMTIIQETGLRPQIYGATGLTVSNDRDTSHMGESSDEQESDGLPW